MEMLFQLFVVHCCPPLFCTIGCMNMNQFEEKAKTRYNINYIK